MRPILAAILCLTAAHVQAQETFRLTVPDMPSLTSRAVLTRTSLTIIDPQGQRFVYQREPTLDDPTGQFRAFRSRGTNQTVRWPVNSVGNFLIGDARGQNWRPSAMTIQPAANVVPQPIPNRQPPRNFGPSEPVRPPGMPTRNQPAGAIPSSGSRRISPDLRAIRDGLAAAWVDDDGQLQLATGEGERWRVDPIGQANALVPGSGVVLNTGATAEIQGVIGVGRDGTVISVSPDGVATPLPGHPPLTPDARLARPDGGRLIYSIDRVGRLIAYDLATGQLAVIDGEPNRYLPGSPVVGLAGQSPSVFTIDRRGTLVQYRMIDGGWRGPLAVDSNFLAGGNLAIHLTPDREVYLGGIDRDRRVSLFRSDTRGWVPVPFPGEGFAPGGSIALSMPNRQLQVNLVDNRHRLISFVQGPNGFVPGPIQLAGFGRQSSLVTVAGSSGFLSVDLNNRVNYLAPGPNGWQPRLFVPGSRFAPLLESREFVAGRPLPTVEIQFLNRSSEELVLQLYDEFQLPREIRIPPGGTTPMRVSRDPGGVFVERQSLWTPGGWITDEVRFAVPAASWQTVVVYANRTTYRYVDRRKNKPSGALDDFSLQSPVSLGVFDLPPGPLLRDGQVFDAARLAALSGNPGAAVLFPPPGTLP